VSKPGRRIYVGKGDIARVLGGLGVAILTTPRGVLTDRSAVRAGVGGELIAKVY
jgi:small subunit ribosomal protein S8